MPNAILIPAWFCYTHTHTHKRIFTCLLNRIASTILKIHRNPKWIPQINFGWWLVWFLIINSWKHSHLIFSFSHNFLSKSVCPYQRLNLNQFFAGLMAFHDMNHLKWNNWKECIHSEFRMLKWFYDENIGYRRIRKWNTFTYEMKWTRTKSKLILTFGHQAYVWLLVDVVHMTRNSIYFANTYEF